MAFVQSLMENVSGFDTTTPENPEARPVIRIRAQRLSHAHCVLVIAEIPAN